MLAQRTMRGPSRRVIYTVPGSYTFTVPTGVTTINVTLVGGGGSGGAGSGSPNFYAGGGGGAGGAAYASRSVSGGQTLAVVVGQNGGSFFNGDDSKVTHNASGDEVEAEGGSRGDATVGSTAGAGGAGGGVASTGSWSINTSQTGTAGNTGQPSGNGLGGAFVTFRGVRGSLNGSGGRGSGSLTPVGDSLAGIVIVEW
jgi:hypothetical protein